MHSVAQVIPAALIELLRTTPMSDGKAQFAWQAAVGRAVDRATEIKLEDGVLIVETSSLEWARELKRSSSVILPRLQQLLGRDAVKSIAVRTHSTSRASRTPGTSGNL